MDFDSIPNEMIYQMCSDMPISELEQFLLTNVKNYEICSYVFNKKISSPEFQYQLKLYERKLEIIDAINKRTDGLTVLDLTYYDVETGERVMLIRRPKTAKAGKIMIAGYPQLYSSPANYVKMMEMMNTENPYETF
jgi:hypothetical protein